MITGQLVKPIAGSILEAITVRKHRVVADQAVELVVNGTFNTGVDGWIAANLASLTWNAGRAVISHTTSANPYARQSVTVEIGKTYRFRCKTFANGLTNTIRVGSTPGSGNVFNSQTVTDQVIDVTFTAAATPLYISVLNFTAVGSGSIEFDDVSLQEV